MYSNQRAALPQQQRILHHIDNTDSYSMFNLLTGPQLFDHVEALLPAHRERSFPPTETLSMFMAQALSPDGSCQQAVNDAAVKLACGVRPAQIVDIAVTCGVGPAQVVDIEIECFMHRWIIKLKGPFLGSKRML